MKHKFASLLCLIALSVSLAAAQQPLPPNSGDKAFNSTTYPVFTLNAAPVPGATINVVGNPGPATWYYWAVANYPVGSVISYLGKVSNAPNVLTSGNYVSITPTVYPAQVTSVDILATSTNAQPAGACACAVATGLTSGAASQISNSTSSYTVTLVDPRIYDLVIRNEVVGSGSTHLLLRNAWTLALVCDLSTGCGGASIYTLQVNGVSLSAGDTVNFNNSTPAHPTNGLNVTWNTSKSGSTDSVSAAIVGDGTSTDCLLGTGVFAACPGASGDVGGSGTGGIIPVWTGSGPSTTLGNTNITYSAGGVTMGSSSPYTSGAGLLENTSPTGSCAGTATFPVPIFGCYGYYDEFSSSSAGTTGVSVGAKLGNFGNNATETLGVGAYVFAAAGANRTTEIGIYAEAYENVTSTVGTREAIYALGENNTTQTSANNRAILAQSGVGAAGTNTADHTIEIAAPVNGGGTFGSHAGLYVPAQGVGVAITLAPQAFSALPACSSTYEGSLMPVSDSSTASAGATITGGGTNHVFGYCNGTNWIVSAGASSSSGVTQWASASGCTSSGSPCTTSVSWPTAFADATYIPICTGAGPVTGQPQAAFVYTSTQLAGSMTVVIDNRGTANPGGFTTVNCSAHHN